MGAQINQVMASLAATKPEVQHGSASQKHTQNPLLVLLSLTGGEGGKHLTLDTWSHVHIKQR